MNMFESIWCSKNDVWVCSLLNFQIERVNNVILHLFCEKEEDFYSKEAQKYVHMNHWLIQNTFLFKDGGGASSIGTNWALLTVLSVYFLVAARKDLP